jgi:uncharacterized membrane protein SpoIIM required for sporulation
MMTSSSRVIALWATCGRVTGVDVDAFSAVHGDQWARLEELARRRRLSGAEADELVALYQLTATHLAAVQSAAPDPNLVARLSHLLARARSVIAGAPEPSWSDLRAFVTRSLPAAFYRIRWWTVAVMVTFCAVAISVGVWATSNPDSLATLGTPDQLRRYADEAFEAYYSNNPAPSFAAQVWTNNAWIAAVSIGLGITGVFPVAMLLDNAIGVGGAAAIMAVHGRLDVFFGLILPHGLLELTAIFVAGAAGLKIFWAWVAPGPRTRGRAIAHEARALVTVAIGLVGVLAVAGLIEAFVTPSSLPPAVRIAIGALALAAFWTYTLVLGGTAVRAGHSADLDEDHAGYTVLMAG